LEKHKTDIPSSPEMALAVTTTVTTGSVAALTTLSTSLVTVFPPPRLRPLFWSTVSSQFTSTLGTITNRV
jgi:hypothetical protein